jgi:hypothetical protein
MGSVTRLVLHIGMNKTGSTALQSFWSQNAEPLRTSGLLYPVTGRVGAMQHVGLADALGFRGAPEPDEEKLSHLRARLDAEVRQTSPDVVLLSSEFLARRRDLRPVRRFLSGYDVSVVVYLRRHDFWMYARYSQAVRSVNDPPWDKGFAGFCAFESNRRDVHVRYRGLVDAWAAAFGADSVVVRPYERQQNRPDLLTDISCAAGLPMSGAGAAFGDGIRNRSLGPLGARLCEEIQRSALHRATKRRAVRAVDRIARCLPRARPRIPERQHDLLRDLVEQNAEDYRYIATRFLGRADGRLFLDPPPGSDWTPGPAP